MAAPRSSDDRGAPQAVRQIDPVAVDAALRRLARRAEPPWLHGEGARRMAARLAVIRLQPAVLVDWWGRTGASAEILAVAYPKARRLVVEPNEALRQASTTAARQPWWAAWRGAARRTEVLDGEPAAGTAQLLWSNMALHAAADPPALLVRWQAALEAGGFAMFSCFGPDTVRELRALYRRLGWAPAGAEFVDMHDLGDMLVHAGFADPVMDQETLTLTWATPEALLAELRGLGGNVATERRPGLCTPRWRERLLGELCTLASADGRLALSFEIVYGHAFKAVPRSPGVATTVSLDDMRALVRSPRAKR